MRLESKELVFVFKGDGSFFEERLALRWRRLILNPKIGLFTFDTKRGVVQAYNYQIFNQIYRISQNPFSSDSFTPEEGRYVLDQPQAVEINNN